MCISAIQNESDGCNTWAHLQSKIIPNPSIPTETASRRPQSIHPTRGASSSFGRRREPAGRRTAVVTGASGSPRVGRRPGDRRAWCPCSPRPRPAVAGSQRGTCRATAAGGAWRRPLAGPDVALVQAGSRPARRVRRRQTIDLKLDKPFIWNGFMKDLRGSG
ncbi:hypothetical protein DAI22_07g128100 [Oryza sativa Japonica Group]|nr:hypothetical protein DAI22_07g128100 [Oryza sativa Japonica Group]